jgi:hypothetical protein
MSAAEVIPFPIIPIRRPDVEDDGYVPGDHVRALNHYRDPNSFAPLDKKLAQSEAALFVELGLVLDEMMRIAGRQFTLEALSVQATVKGLTIQTMPVE